MRNLDYDQLNDTAQYTAISQINERHPVATRSENILDLVKQYEYNRFGEIMEDKHEFEGLDPEYYSERLGD